MRYRLSALPIVALVTLAPALSVAQQTPVVPVGTRVRFSPEQTTGDKVVGTIARQRGDTLLLWTERQDTVPVALTNLDRLEVSDGVHGHALKGLGLGLLAGAVLGGAIGAAVEPDELLGRGINILVGVVGGAGGGAVIGLGVGAAIRSERWKAIAPGDEGRSALPPSGDRIAVRLSLRF